MIKSYLLALISLGNSCRKLWVFCRKTGVCRTVGSEASRVEHDDIRSSIPRRLRVRDFLGLLVELAEPGLDPGAQRLKTLFHPLDRLLERSLADKLIPRPGLNLVHLGSDRAHSLSKLPPRGVDFF